MADKKVKLHTLMITGIARPELLLHSPATAAEKLGVHEKYIYRLVNEGHLERLVITDAKGVAIGSGITYDSVTAYSKRERKRRQRELPLGRVDTA